MRNLNGHLKKIKFNIKLAYFKRQSENWDSSLRRMFKLASKNILIKDHKEQRLN